MMLPDVAPAGAQPDSHTVMTRFGSFVGRTTDIVTLAEGLPGFESSRRFFLLTSPSIQPLMCLQGVDGERPAFLAIDPRQVDPDYACELDDLQRQRLAAAEATPLLWLALVRLVDGGAATVNLRAPLVINPQRMRGLQVLAGRDHYGTESRLG